MATCHGKWFKEVGPSLVYPGDKCHKRIFRVKLEVHRGLQNRIRNALAGTASSCTVCSASDGNVDITLKISQPFNRRTRRNHLRNTCPIQMADPIPGVKYRIKSVDFLTYLEILNPDVRLRPAKETDRQFWQFEKVPNSTGYFVRNVAVNNRYLYLRTGNVSSDTMTANAVVNVSYRDGAYRLAFYFEHSNYYFHTSDNNISLVRVTAINKNLDGQKWQLVPVTTQPIYKDPLGSGNYCIRNLNGKSLLTMPDGNFIGSANVYVRSQIDESPSQRWAITRQNSGQYTIQIASNDSYLGSSSIPAKVGDGVVGLQTIYLWDIQSVGGSAWSLHIPDTNISIGVVDNEVENGNEVNLVHSDTTPSQMWFMEKSDSPGEVQRGRNKMYAKREVLEGKYLLRNAIYDSNHDPIYMNVSVSQPDSWITPGTAATFPFELKYVGEKSAHFKLTYVETDSALIVVDLEDYIGLSSDASKGSEFVLLEKIEGDPGYVICRPDSGRPPKVVSGRAHARSDLKKPVFSIDNKVSGNALQMWVLVPSRKAE